MSTVGGASGGLSSWEIVCWVLLGIVQIDLLSISVGLARWRAVIFLQSITPLLLPVAAVLAIVAALTGHPIAMAIALVQVSWILLLFARLVHQQRRPAPTTTAELRIAHANMLHSNPSPKRAVADVLASDADIIAFSEITAGIHGHAEQHPAATNWPHRIHDLRDGPRGIALWSKLPLSTATIERMHDCHAVIAVIDGDLHFQVLAVHPMAPVSPVKTKDWRPSLETIGQVLLASALPTVAIGDYNATHWHPPMRRLYRQGVHSAHLRIGRFLSATFPVGRRLRPFVLLDHALVTTDVQIHQLSHLAVTGSDHRGIVVDVSFDPNSFSRADRSS